jgi:hypothetical protein
VLDRIRHLFIRKQTSVINAIWAHCAEFGITAPVGRQGVEELLNVILTPLNGMLFINVMPLTSFAISALEGLAPTTAQILGAGLSRRSCWVSKAKGTGPMAGPPKARLAFVLA